MKTKFLAAIVLSALLVGCSAQGKVARQDLEKPQLVDDFTLTNQKNQAFSFSSTKGKVVLVTFLYTHCEDVCSFEALKMAQALKLLGAEASQVALVAITTDPDRDTVPVIADYSRELGIYDQWDFLTGPKAAVEAVWKKFDVTVAFSDAKELGETEKHAHELGIQNPAGEAKRSEPPTQGLSDAEITTATRTMQKYSGGYEVAHVVPFWLIDRQGNRRLALGPTASPKDLAAEIKKLLSSTGS